MVEERLGNPTPIGLMGLAIGCAALAPAELHLTDMADPMIWVWMLMTAGILQIYAGVVDLVNRNILGATAFTLYGTLWVISAWKMGGATVFGTSHGEVKGFVYLVYLPFTIFMTIGFATVSRTLFTVFVSFIVIFLVEVIAAFVPAFHGVAVLVAGVLHAISAGLCLWAAAGSVINPILGKNVFKQGAPLLVSHGDAPQADDFESLLRHQGIRKKIVTQLYHFWESHAWDWIATDAVGTRTGIALDDLAPDFWYLYQRGLVEVDEEYLIANPGRPKHVRITSTGIDYYREIQMGKFKF